MKPLSLVSVVTENYLPRALPFLKSLRSVSSPGRFCVCLGFEPTPTFRGILPHVHFRPMPMHWSADNGIFQHGRWLDALPAVADDHLYMLTDADIIVQRDFTAAEIARFQDYDNRTFGAGWNAGFGDTLEAEAFRMGMENDGTFGDDWNRIPCLNTGVLIARGYAWRRLRDLYESRVRGFWKLNQHRSRCQWLLCWCLHRLGSHIDFLSQDIHAHGHHGMPNGVSIRDGAAWHGDQKVMLRHAL